MDSYPDASEKILNLQHLKHRMLQTEKKIADLKSQEQKKTD